MAPGEGAPEKSGEEKDAGEDEEGLAEARALLTDWLIYAALAAELAGFTPQKSLNK